MGRKKWATLGQLLRLSLLTSALSAWDGFVPFPNVTTRLAVVIRQGNSSSALLDRHARHPIRPGLQNHWWCSWSVAAPLIVRPCMPTEGKETPPEIRTPFRPPLSLDDASRAGARVLYLAVSPLHPCPPDRRGVRHGILITHAPIFPYYPFGILV